MDSDRNIELHTMSMSSRDLTRSHADRKITSDNGYLLQADVYQNTRQHEDPDARRGEGGKLL